jgi:hypothetical protein
MGLKKAEELTGNKSFTLGSAMLPNVKVPELPAILRFGVWSYAGIGLLALLTFFTNQNVPLMASRAYVGARQRVKGTGTSCSRTLRSLGGWPDPLRSVRPV